MTGSFGNLICSNKVEPRCFCSSADPYDKQEDRGLQRGKPVGHINVVRNAGEYLPIASGSGSSECNSRFFCLCASQDQANRQYPVTVLLSLLRRYRARPLPPLPARTICQRDIQNPKRYRRAPYRHCRFATSRGASRNPSFSLLRLHLGFVATRLVQREFLQRQVACRCRTSRTNVVSSNDPYLSH